MKKTEKSPAAFASAGSKDNPIPESAMTDTEFKIHRKEICRLLRLPTDPPPRRLKSGAGPPTQPCTNVRKAIVSSGGRLVRGWKLIFIRWGDARPRDHSYKALPHVVVERGGVYTCVTSDPVNENFIFLPSSLMAPSLNDEQLLSGSWCLTAVVGGSLIEFNQLAAQTYDFLATSPALALPRLNPTAQLPVSIFLWLKLHRPELDPVRVAAAVGFPTFAAKRDGDKRPFAVAVHNSDHPVLKALQNLNEEGLENSECLEKFDGMMERWLKDAEERGLL